MTAWPGRHPAIGSRRECENAGTNARRWPRVIESCTRS